MCFTFGAECAKLFKSQKDAPVAQGIEQWFPVPRVRGSNPFRCVFSCLFYGDSEVADLKSIQKYYSERYLRKDIFQDMFSCKYLFCIIVLSL